MDKAYERIGWSFIFGTKKALGFGPQMCNVVMRLGEGSLSRLLFNEKVVGAFKVNRSIWQGYHLAPLLFVVCSHPLATSLEEEARKSNLEGLQLPNN